MKIPRWYTRSEVKQWFERRGISHSPKEIQIFTEALQGSFEKGWKKGQHIPQPSDLPEQAPCSTKMVVGEWCKDCPDTIHCHHRPPVR